MIQVSIVVLTYNADPGKLRRTLAAAASQKQVSFEIIVCDDGSVKKDFSLLDEQMHALGVANYRLIENPQNKGTVQNCLSGIRAASGEYVFLTSPGDLLYDDLVMRDFYRFAKEKECRLCFGNSVFYHADEQGLHLTRQYGTPADPSVYGENFRAAKAAFFGGSWIIGASYFRQRDLALEYFEKIADTSVYMEDTTSTAFALADGIPVRHFDRNIVWYEDGSGISTGASEKWQGLLNQDLTRSFEKLKKEHPKDPCVDLALQNLLQKNRCKRIASRLLRHPGLFLRNVCEKKRKPVPISCSQVDMERLSKMLFCQG